MSQTCKKCNEKMALMSGWCNFVPDDEPFESGEYVEIDIAFDTEEKIHAHFCLKCKEFDKEIWID